MRGTLRQSVQSHYDFRCGYCGVSQTDVGSDLTLDHFQPRAQGGDDRFDNLVYCCHPCNEFKHDYWRTEPELRLLHPLLDQTATHYREYDDGTLIALTERGTNHLRVLHLNRPELIAHRLRKRFYDAREFHYREVEDRIETLEKTLQSVLRQIGREFGDPTE